MKHPPLCLDCGRPMVRGDVTNLRTGEKLDKFFCRLHVRQNVLAADVPESDTEEPEHNCPGCAAPLTNIGYKFICGTEGCHYHKEWGQW